jgi:hypothetical protein
MNFSFNKEEFDQYSLAQFFKLVYDIEKKANESPDDRAAQENRQTLRKDYLGIKQLLLDTLDSWATDEILNGEPNGYELGVFYWLMQIGDLDLIKACSDKGASAILGRSKSPQSPLYEALVRLADKYTNPDYLWPRKEIFFHLWKMALNEFSALGKQGIDIENGSKEVLGKTMIVAVQRFCLPEVALELINAGFNERYTVQGLNMNILHAAMIAKHTMKESDGKTICDQIIKIALEKSQERDEAGHIAFINGLGRYAYNIYTPLRLIIKFNPVDLENLNLLYAYGAVLGVSAKTREELDTFYELDKTQSICNPDQIHLTPSVLLSIKEYEKLLVALLTQLQKKRNSGRECFLHLLTHSSQNG